MDRIINLFINYSNIDKELENNADMGKKFCNTLDLIEEASGCKVKTIFYDLNNSNLQNIYINAYKISAMFAANNRLNFFEALRGCDSIQRRSRIEVARSVADVQSMIEDYAVTFEQNERVVHMNLYTGGEPCDFDAFKGHCCSKYYKNKDFAFISLSTNANNVINKFADLDVIGRTKQVVAAEYNGYYPFIHFVGSAFSCKTERLCDMLDVAALTFKHHQWPTRNCGSATNLSKMPSSPIKI